MRRNCPTQSHVVVLVVVVVVIVVVIVVVVVTPIMIAHHRIDADSRSRCAQSARNIVDRRVVEQRDAAREILGQQNLSKQQTPRDRARTDIA